MIKNSLLTACLFLGIIDLSAQGEKFKNLPETISSVDNLSNPVCDVKTPFLISYKALDKFMARRIPSLLTGSEDISLYRAYLVANPLDGNLLIGYNTQFSSPEDGYLNIINLGFKLKMFDNIAPIFSNNKPNDYIIFQGRWSHFFKGSIFFNKSCDNDQQKQKMYNERILIKAKLDYEYDTEKSKVLATAVNIQDPALKEKFLEKVKELEKNKYKKMYEYEADVLEEKGLYNYASTKWLTFGLDLPVVKTKEYLLLDSAFVKKGQFNFRRYNFYSSYNYFGSSPKCNVFLSLGLNAYYSNNIIEKGITSDNRKKLKLLDTKVDTITYIEVKGNEQYIANYSSFFVSNLNIKAAINGKTKGNISAGVDFEGQLNDLIKYRKLNLLGGIPISIKGEKDKIYSIEPYIQFNDVLIVNDKLKNDKLNYSLGFRIGLPFTNFLK